MNDTSGTIVERVQSDYDLTRFPSILDPSYQLYWFTLTIKLGGAAQASHIAEYVARTGQWRYLAPIYQALIDAGESEIALNFYNANKFNYPP